MSIIEKKRGRPKGSDNQLDAKIIIDSAKLMMQQKGKIPSIRSLANALNVDGMAIYYYFSNKNALLEAITTSLIDEVYQPKLDENWKLALHKLCSSYLNLLNDHPGLLETLLNMESNNPAEIFIERFNRIIAPIGLDDNSTKDALDLLVDYLHGYALALNCSASKGSLDIDMISGPLQIFCLALEGARKVKL